MNNFDRFIAQRDLALSGITPEWERAAHFNWALDYFDQVQSDDPALIEVVPRLRHWSYRDLSRESCAVANQMLRLGINSEDRVMVLLENSSDFYLTMLALIKLRCFFVPCAANLSALELTVRADILQPTAVITCSRGAMRHDRTLVAGVDKHLAFVDDVDDLPGDHWLPLHTEDRLDRSTHRFASGPGNAAMMGVFTSGTTSRPKLVVHSHVSYPVGHLSSAYWQGLGANDIHLNIAHPGWAKHSWSSFFVPLSVGAAVVIPPAGITQPIQILEAVAEVAITSICAPPSWWRQVVKHAPKKNLRLCNATAAGEALDPQTRNFFLQQWQLDLREGYGQSELTAVFGQPPGGGSSRLMPGYEGAVVLDERQQPGPDEGELAFSLDRPPLGLMLGYYHQGTVAYPPGHYYRTGDLVTVNRSGVLLTGRHSNVFKSYDVKVSPEELERNFMASGLLEDILIYQGLDEHNEPVPCARYIALEPPLTIETLQTWQVQNLSHHQHVRHFVAVGSLDRNTSGKKVRL